MATTAPAVVLEMLQMKLFYLSEKRLTPDQLRVLLDDVCIALEVKPDEVCSWFSEVVKDARRHAVVDSPRRSRSTDSPTGRVYDVSRLIEQVRHQLNGLPVPA